MTGLTSDPDDARLMHGFDQKPRPGPAEAYLILSKEERAKGFRRPLRHAYKHIDPECEGVTTMSAPLAETYACDPHFYGATYCAKCKMHRPVGENGEFVWLDMAGNVTTEYVGT